MVKIQEVSKNYTAGGKKNSQNGTVVHALKNVSLSVEAGEFTSLAGPSGSGKTTLLNLIGCLDTPDKGMIFIDNELIGPKSPNDLATLRRDKIGFIFQSFNLIPVLSAYENVAFALNIQNLPDREIRERAMGILEEVGLGDMAGRRPAELSGGQQQRVAIARALVKKPLLLLADEPTANLDSKTGESILHLMADLNGKLGTTFLFSTHDRMVMDFARRLVMLHDGEVTSDERRQS